MHKRFSFVAATLMAFALGAVAQTSSSTPQTSPSNETKQEEKKEGEKKEAKKDKEKKEKKDDKKDKDKKDKPGSDPIDTSAVFNERIANDLLGQIRDGLEGHSRRLMLSAFDSDKMDGYLSFEDQIDAYFERYEAFRVRFRISNVTVEGTKGVVLVDTEMEQIPRGGAQPQRKRGFLRFELELGRKGWRVVDFRDRSFFS